MTSSYRIRLALGFDLATYSWRTSPPALGRTLVRHTHKQLRMPRLGGTSNIVSSSLVLFEILAGNVAKYTANPVTILSTKLYILYYTILYPNTDAPFSLLAPITSHIKLITELMMIAWDTPTKAAAISIGSRLAGLIYITNDASNENPTPIASERFLPIFRDSLEVFADVIIEQR